MVLVMFMLVPVGHVTGRYQYRKNIMKGMGRSLQNALM